jgi:hypothetical protein
MDGTEVLEEARVRTGARKTPLRGSQSGSANPHSDLKFNPAIWCCQSSVRSRLERMHQASYSGLMNTVVRSPLTR